MGYEAPPIHAAQAVYWAAITVIGRPGVQFSAQLTPVLMTFAALLSATIIPT